MGWGDSGRSRRREEIEGTGIGMKSKKKIKKKKYLSEDKMNFNSEEGDTCDHTRLRRLEEMAIQNLAESGP